MASEIVKKHVGASCILAHRHNLVQALSCALAEQGIYHDVIASTKARRAIAAVHVKKFGHCYYRPGAPCRVASVDTIIRATGLEQWAAQVTLVVPDEAHHVVLDNKWHRALDMFTHPACRGLLPTATPRRADGKGLGRHADGVADAMVQAPPMRWLIENGYLCDYDIVCPQSDLVMMREAGATGDWSTEQLREAAKNSHIVGDTVEAYKATHRASDGGTMSAYGKRCVTFCTDVKTATETTAAFLAAGIPTATLTGETEFGLQEDILRRLESGQLWNVCAVDIISEGFDLPAIEAVIMARPTQSLALYMQQFGRALRTMFGKTKAIIIDLVSNVLRHQGPPDRPRVWSLDRRDKRGKKPIDDAEPIRICVGTREVPGCMKPYSALLRACEHCGLEPPIPSKGGRAGPKEVEGDVGLMDAKTLAMLRGDIDRVNAPPAEEAARLRALFMPGIGVDAGVNRHVRTQAAQTALRTAMALWGGTQRAAGLTDIQMQKKFWFTFGVDVITAQALKAADADALRLLVDASVIDG